jgi:hypothetical protein
MSNSKYIGLFLSSFNKYFCGIKPTKNRVGIFRRCHYQDQIASNFRIIYDVERVYKGVVVVCFCLLLPEGTGPNYGKFQ